ncbi:Uncharacterized protein FWK35_00029577 [Aphis craccivora]|uniref:Uncharacterized protein n=1 Tax=Aphis craccivora TaxID=307492 RepID=A0A6G0YAQ8_APHCR|nr:Uncharacterized protein FWK35_00029577 [Aphis craccivora]
MSSYVSVLFIVILFLITDYLQYKPIIILNGLSGIMSYSLLLGSPTIFVLKSSQIFLMLFRAAEVAHYTYMFAKIENQDQYQIATCIIKTSIMIGKKQDNAIIQRNINESTNVNLDKKNIKNYFIKMKFSEVIQKLWDDFNVAYTDANVFKWSVWWSLSFSGYVLVSHYIQLHWEEIEPHGEQSPLNGAVESLATLLSAATIYAIGRVNGSWDEYGDIIMAIVAMGLGVMLYFLSLTKSLTKSYVYYIIFCCTYQTMATISRYNNNYVILRKSFILARVAKFLKRNCYALIFGFNKLIGYILIIIFTIIIVEDKLFSFDIRQQYLIFFQFLIYSVYFMFLGCFFLLMAFVSFRRL